jgi:hypothetical protein
VGKSARGCSVLCFSLRQVFLLLGAQRFPENLNLRRGTIHIVADALVYPAER